MPKTIVTSLQIVAVTLLFSSTANAGFCRILWAQFPLSSTHKTLSMVAKDLSFSWAVPYIRRNLIKAYDSLGSNAFHALHRLAVSAKAGRASEQTFVKDIFDKVGQEAPTPERIKEAFLKLEPTLDSPTMKLLRQDPLTLDVFARALSSAVWQRGTEQLSLGQALSSFLLFPREVKLSEWRDLEPKFETKDGVKQFRVPDGMKRRDAETLYKFGEYERDPQFVRELSEIVGVQGLKLGQGIYTYVITPDGKVSVGTSAAGVRHVELLGGRDPVVIGAGEFKIDASGQIREVNESTGHFRVFGTQGVLEKHLLPSLKPYLSPQFQLVLRERGP